MPENTNTKFMPPIIIAIIGGLELAMKYAPQAIELFNKAREFIAALFGAGVITAEQQNKVMLRINELETAALTGQKPGHWEVEADPTP